MASSASVRSAIKFETWFKATFPISAKSPGAKSVRQSFLGPVFTPNEIGGGSLRLGGLAQVDCHLVDCAIEGERNFVVFGYGRPVVAPDVGRLVE